MIKSIKLKWFWSNLFKFKWVLAMIIKQLDNKESIKGSLNQLGISIIINDKINFNKMIKLTW